MGKIEDRELRIMNLEQVNKKMEADNDELEKKSKKMNVAERKTREAKLREDLAMRQLFKTHSALEKIIGQKNPLGYI